MKWSPFAELLGRLLKMMFEKRAQIYKNVSQLFGDFSRALASSLQNDAQNRPSD
jgi:hypothetical protein